jgi:hypothetical protein
MSAREIPPIKVEQAEISDYILGPGAKVTGQLRCPTTRERYGGTRSGMRTPPANA